MRGKNFLIYLKSINIENPNNIQETEMTTGKNSPGRDPAGEGVGCTPGSGCRVEAILSVDERGQMVLPKDVREKAEIRTGDKLALISWSRNGVVCCLALMKADNLSGMVKEVIGPLMQEPENQ
jgi:AbrB family looped-hinge helix DNA binding protein